MLLVSLYIMAAPPTAMHAVLAIIAGGGRAIFVIYREGVEINYFLLYSIDSAKTL
jgi:glycerate-2-kinase